MVAAVLSIFPVIRTWWRSVLSRPGPAVFLMLALAVTLIGTGERADVSAIQYGAPDAYRVVRAALTGSLFLVACMGIITDVSRVRLAGRGAQWMVAFAFMAMASAIYSVDAFISLWKGFEVMTLVLVAVSLAGQLRTAEDLNWLMNVACLLLFYIILTVYVGLALYPGEAIKDVEYLGVRGLVPLLNPASVGSISALLVVCAIGNLIHRWPSKRETAGIWVVFLAAVGTLILAHARTPIFSAAFAIMFMLIAGRHYRFAVWAGLAGTGLIFAISIDDMLEYLYRGQTQEAFVGLTGRMNYWENLLWPKINSSPFLGYGYYAAQRAILGTSSVDNAYLEVLIGLGFLGLSVFLIPVFLALKGLMRTRPRSGMPIVNKFLWAQIMGIFAIIVIRALTGAAFQVQHPVLVFYMLSQIGVAALLRLQSEKKPAQAAARKDMHEKPALYRKGQSRVMPNRSR